MNKLLSLTLIAGIFLASTMVNHAQADLAWTLNYADNNSVTSIDPVAGTTSISESLFWGRANSDTLDVSITFGAGMAAVSVVSENFPGLDWNNSFPYSTGYSSLVSVILQVSDQADDGLNNTIILQNEVLNGVSIPGQAEVGNGNVAEIDTTTADLSSLDYQIVLEDPDRVLWQRVNNAGPAYFNEVDIIPEAAPEPSTLAMLGIVVLVLFFMCQRRVKKQTA